MIVLDRLLVGGLRFVLDKVSAAAEAELDDPETLREELLALQMRHELGDVDDDEMAVRERELLDRLRELRADEQAGPISFAEGGVGVDLGFAGDEEPSDG